jgi:hypothetical protein
LRGQVIEGQKNVPKNKCQEKCIAFCDSYGSTSRENHLSFFDLSTGLALKHIKDNFYSILLDSKVVNYIPNHFPISIDIENFPSVNGRHFAARVAVITYTIDKNKKKSDFVIAFHALLNMSDKKLNTNIPKKFISINPSEHENNVQSIDRMDALGFVEELMRTHKTIFKNFSVDFLSLLNSGLQLTQSFDKYEFYEIQDFFVTKSEQKDKNEEIVYKPLSLEWLKTYVLLRLNELVPKHDPIIDASNHLLLFNKIPVNERNKCKIQSNIFDKVMKNFDKQCLKK